VRARPALATLASCWLGSTLAWGYDAPVNYQLNCMGCHLADGSGEAGRVPSLRRSLVLLSADAQGRNYIIRVPGVAQSPLSDADTAALLNWMARNLSDVVPSPSFVDYSEAEVRRYRSEPLAKVSEVRARLMSRRNHGAVAHSSGP
jgi:hypothetical protein